MPYDSTYIIFLKWQNYEMENRLVEGQVLEEGGWCVQEGIQGTLVLEVLVVYLTLVSGPLNLHTW